MSRYYELELKFKSFNDEEIKLNKFIINRFIKCENVFSEDDDGVYTYCYKLFLSGGISEEEHFNRIKDSLKEIDKDVKVYARYTYLEDLPYSEYGDDF